MIRKEQMRSYVQIVVGCILGGLAYPLFLVPNSIAPGGLTGIATILNHLFGVPVGLTSMVMNLPLFVIGFRAMGRVFVWRSLVATVLFSLSIDLIHVPPMTNDVLLGAVYGGGLLGLGLGIILRGEATSGGSDMVARMVHRKFSFISVGAFLFAIDFLVIVAAGFVLGSQHAMYALICIFVSSKVLDVVLGGFNTQKACFVITEKTVSVTNRIMEELERGVTLLTATGAYSGRERPVILCVAGRQEVPRVKEIVRQEDEKAFMFITEAHEALGEGFTKLMEDK
jgi:uncharacterized membrane-anchored protein YitT (DUF2179 family)